MLRRITRGPIPTFDERAMRMAHNAVPRPSLVARAVRRDAECVPRAARPAVALVSEAPPATVAPLDQFTLLWTTVDLLSDNAITRRRAALTLGRDSGANSLRELITAIQKSDALLRAAAFAGLRLRTDAAVHAAVREALWTLAPDSDIAEEIVTYLCERADRESVQTLVVLATVAPLPLRGLAQGRVLSIAQSRLIPHVKAFASHLDARRDMPSRAIRRTMVFLLSHLGTPAAARVLCDWIEHAPDLPVRALAARALGALLRPERACWSPATLPLAYQRSRHAGLSVLRAALRNTEEAVRASAALALGFAHAQGSAAALIELVRCDESRAVKNAAMRALRVLRSARAAAPVTALLLRSTDPFVQLDAMRVLGEIGDALSADVLRAMMTHHATDPVIQTAALETLARLREAHFATAEWLHRLHQMTSEADACEAAQVLAQRADDLQVLEAMRTAVRGSPFPMVRRVAIQYVARHASARSRAVLLAALATETVATVRAGLLYALCELPDAVRYRAVFAQCLTNPAESVLVCEAAVYALANDADEAAAHIVMHRLESLVTQRTAFARRLVQTMIFELAQASHGQGRRALARLLVGDAVRAPLPSARARAAIVRALAGHSDSVVEAALTAAVASEADARVQLQLAKAAVSQDETRDLQIEKILLRSNFSSAALTWLIAALEKRATPDVWALLRRIYFQLPAGRLKSRLARVLRSNAQLAHAPRTRTKHTMGRALRVV